MRISLWCGCWLLASAAMSNLWGAEPNANAPCNSLRVVKAHPTPPPPPAIATSQSAALNEEFDVVVQGVSQCLTGATPPVLVPYLDGIPLKGVGGRLLTANEDRLRFLLRRTEANQSAWDILLRTPAEKKTVTLSVGPESGTPVPTDILMFELRILACSKFVGWAISMIVLGGLIYWAGASSDVFRDSGPQPDPTNPALRKPFSLARVQMAVWFCLVVAAYSLIYFAKNDMALGASVLALIGISAGTGFSAAIIDSSKQTALKARMQELGTQITSLVSAGAAPTQVKVVQDELEAVKKQLGNAPSQGLWPDLFSDANGISFHRIQMLVWTIVFIIVFVRQVASELKMPAFDTTTLGLMGISAGTYLGFKFPEQKNPDVPQVGRGGGIG